MRRSANPYPVIVSLPAGVFFIAFLGIAQQRAGLFYLYNLVLLPIPFIAVPRNRRLYRFVAGIATVAIIAVVLGSHWFLEFNQPLMPFHERWMVRIVAYITLILIVFTLAAYFYYIWRQNTETGASKPVLFNQATVPSPISSDLPGSQSGFRPELTAPHNNTIPNEQFTQKYRALLG